MPTSLTPLIDQIRSIDEQLSRRPLDLDPAGYFIIYLDRERQLICAKHFSTVINEQGLATDPNTGAVIPARGPVQRSPERIYVGRTAKELCVQLFEGEAEAVVSQLSHAAYLGREFQKAEAALIDGGEYIQD
jgi:dihydropteroate synthase